MINLAVVEIKDIIKYLVKLTIVITIIIALTRYFSGLKTKLNTDDISSKPFMICLDTVIPSIKNVNYNDEKVAEKLNPLKMACGVEIGMINALSENKKDEAKENNNNSPKNDEENSVEEAKTGIKTEVQESIVPEKFTVSYKTVKVKNDSDLKLTSDMLVPDVNLNMKDIIIYHTHASESYTPTEKYSYKKSGNFRTLDTSRSVIRVGTELEKYMKSYGYNITHDTTVYDYPSYNDSYNRSLYSIGKMLEKNKETEVLFDIHRDAIADSTYAPTVKIGDEYASQLMFVIGSSGGGNKHDNWNINLKFAVKIQEKANEMYPGLFKPIILRNSRYNQQLAKGSCIIEVGATGNTLEQSLTSMKYLSKVLSEM